MENKNQSVQFLKYAGTAIALLVMFFFGVKFIHQPESKELPSDFQPKAINEKQENEQDEKVVLDNEPKEEKLIASLFYAKKKTAELKEQNEIENLVVIEDTIVKAENVVEGKAKEEPVFPGIIDMISVKFVDYAVGLHIPDRVETNRKPETILKDVEVLTRNQDFTYIVDGVRVDEETFRLLNPNDIESIDIYKHADATQALYGDKDNQSRITKKN